jgi:hypothetical protein
MPPSAHTISIARNWLDKFRQTDAPHRTTQVRNENVSHQNEEANPSHVHHENWNFSITVFYLVGDFQ